MEKKEHNASPFQRANEPTGKTDVRVVGLSNDV